MNAGLFNAAAMNAELYNGSKDISSSMQPIGAMVHITRANACTPHTIISRGTITATDNTE